MLRRQELQTYGGGVETGFAASAITEINLPRPRHNPKTKPARVPAAQQRPALAFGGKFKRRDPNTNEVHHATVTTRSSGSARSQGRSRRDPLP